MTCECCTAAAVMRFSWHTEALGFQSGNLCQAHVDEAMSRLKPLMASEICHATWCEAPCDLKDSLYAPKEAA
jgi:hypothetical protein